MNLPFSKKSACHIMTDGSISRLPPTILGLMWFEAASRDVPLIDAALIILRRQESRDKEE